MTIPELYSSGNFHHSIHDVGNGDGEGLGSRAQPAPLVERTVTLAAPGAVSLTRTAE